MRTWAKAQGMQVSERGRVSATVQEAYRKAHELGREPQPGLALLRLAQGKVAEAEAALRHSLDDDGRCEEFREWSNRRLVAAPPATG